MSGQLSFGQGRVDFIVTNLMQQHDRPALAALELGDQMMQALPRICGNLPAAQRANRHRKHCVDLFRLCVPCFASHLGQQVV